MLASEGESHQTATHIASQESDKCIGAGAGESDDGMGTIKQAVG
jgi:hypothetical protein